MKLRDLFEKALEDFFEMHENLFSKKLEFLKKHWQVLFIIGMAVCILKLFLSIINQ